MNITNLINFESMVIHGAQTQSNELNTFVANSVRVVVEEFFMKMAPSFIIVVSCRRSSPFNFYLIILQHLFNMVDYMNVQLVVVNFEKPQRIEGSRLYNLLLVDSLEAFLDIDVNSYTNNYDTNEYYYIFLMQRDRYTADDMEGIFQYCWTYNIINCNVQTQNGLGEVHMFTYFPYKQNHCGHTAAKMINQFVNNSWINRQIFLPKLKNFYGCPLRAVVRHIPPYLMVEKQNGRAVSFTGFEMSLVYHLAQHLNFTLDIQEALHDDRIFPYAEGAMKMLIERSADFALGFYRKRSFRVLSLTTTFPHYQNDIVNAIYLKGHGFSTYQVLSFPYRNCAWIAIIVSCLTTICITRLLRINRPESIRTFSVIACSLGLPVNEQPSCLLTIWLWSTFILRSIYSGLLYYLFSNIMLPTMPTSLENAVNQSYRTVMNRFTLNDIRNVPYYERYEEHLSVVMNSSNEMIALPFLEEHFDENLVAIISKEFLIYYADINRKPGQFYIIPDILLQQQLCIYLSKHSFLINQFDTDILEIQSIGLMEYWAKQFVNLKYFESTHTHVNKMIDQDDLWGIYIICGFGHLVALCLYIIEMLSIKYEFLRKLFH